MRHTISRRLTANGPELCLGEALRLDILNHWLSDRKEFWHLLEPLCSTDREKLIRSLKVYAMTVSIGCQKMLFESDSTPVSEELRPMAVSSLMNELVGMPSYKTG
jgi:hypothetical protein